MKTEEQLLQMNERLERMETKLDKLTHKQSREQPLWISFGLGFIVVFLVGIIGYTVVGVIVG
ncbi:hypothetical protein [Paenibacillus daejeonensis]|uniref:hypothetical protein n=1 Tax=Paenibacillus daejeonensis TaxID=135193 RepID=UPI00036F89A6|nr:hypothetical protein [Paenibacillus daejeonensis]